MNLQTPTKDRLAGVVARLLSSDDNALIRNALANCSRGTLYHIAAQIPFHVDLQRLNHLMRREEWTRSLELADGGGFHAFVYNPPVKLGDALS